MISFDSRGLLELFPELDPSKQAHRIPELLKKIEERNQGFWSDTVLKNNHEEIKTFYTENREKYDHVVILGIGGSGLGAKALKESIGYPPNPPCKGGKKEENPPSPLFQRGKKVVILDNIDPDSIVKKTGKLDLERTLFLIISKSGNTPETIAQYLYFQEQLQEKALDLNEHMVFIGGKAGTGFLQQEARKHALLIFDLPENVGGRFSVLTNVGLLPALFMGIDTDELLGGAREMRELFLSEDTERNFPFQLALWQYELWKQGYEQNVFYAYSSALYGLLLWERQLLAESMGKEGKGMTPIASLGASDQHSQNQLYFDGPQNKFFVFLEVLKQNYELKLPNNDLVGDSMNKLFMLEKKGTELALQDEGCPQMTIQIPEKSARSLGQLFLLFQASTAFLGELFEINAFDQPAVERSKNITRDLLRKTL